MPRVLTNMMILFLRISLHATINNAGLCILKILRTLVDVWMYSKINLSFGIWMHI